MVKGNPIFHSSKVRWCKYKDSKGDTKETTHHLNTIYDFQVMTVPKNGKANANKTNFSAMVIKSAEIPEDMAKGSGNDAS